MQTRIVTGVDFQGDPYYEAQYRGWFLWHEIGRFFTTNRGDEMALRCAKMAIDVYIAKQNKDKTFKRQVIRYPLHRDD